MAINLQSTNTVGVNGVKILVYGEAGAGKTTLISTLKDCVVLSAESGLLSLRKHDIPFVQIDSVEQAREAYKWLVESDEAKKFKSVALDSVSEIAEVVLAEEMDKTKDGRQAYGQLKTVMTTMIRLFRDLPGRNVYFSAKADRTPDDKGALIYQPSMPGKSLTQDLPYFFDEVLALRVFEKEGEVKRALQTKPDGFWSAKDRSGVLEQYVKPDLDEVIRRINESV